MENPNIAIKEKVLQYETFLNDVLKEDLRKIHVKLDQLQSELFEYIQLKNYIETVKSNKLNEATLNTQVDIGCNIFLQAKVEDPEHILVAVGLGYYVDLPLDKALSLVNKKIKFIEDETVFFKKKSAVTKSHIKMVLLGLMEIQNLK
ncbi:protein UXT homolog [Halyomorpha halys]|uniref:protein UXT homolog n=1 Tax=Halyomorpha halys TaxID=286706 RepID=UPI0006D5282F|nr:protein UXT homolog [Halyomorpha halys]